MNGTMRSGTKLRFIHAKATHDAEEIGARRPEHTPMAELGPGEVGYLIAGIKDVGEARAGETVTEAGRPGRAARGLPRAQADGVLRHLPDRRRRVPGAARGARRSCGSTTPPTPTSPRPRARWASGSAAASSGCSTWRSSASGSSASSTSASSPRHRRCSTSCTRSPGPRRSSTTRASCRRWGRSSTSRSRTSPSRSSRPPTTRARSWSCARPAAARCRSSSTCRPSAWSSSTGCRWPRSSPTSSTR